MCPGTREARAWCVSSSSRVTTFLSTVSRYRVHIRHIDGVANLPSDFGSRNPCEYQKTSCHVCKFIDEMEDSIVLSFHERCYRWFCQNAIHRPRCLERHSARMPQPQAHSCSLDSRDTPFQEDLTRFNKICHPSQRPRWQVDKEAIGLSRVQQCSSTYSLPS